MRSRSSEALQHLPPQTGARSALPITSLAIFFAGFGIFALYKSKKA